MISITKLLFLFGLVCASSANPVPTTTLEGRLLFANNTPFNITTRITLNNAEYTTYSRADGSFAIHNVSPGIHQLDIHSTTYHFGQVKIQLLEESMDTPKCLEYPYPSAAKQPIKYPLELSPQATYQYFEQRKGFSIFSLLKNPMAIMMLVSVGLMFLMPKMMADLDPADQEQMKKHMAAQQDPTKMLSQMWGDLTGGENKAEDPAAARRARRRAKKD